MKNTRKYIVYITYYTGTKLPLFYIGSSYKEKILNGYNGSVTSEKYKEIYKSEQKHNKHLFKTRILSYHKTRTDALKEELRLQKLHLVVKNNRYFNEAYAQPNGFYGRDVGGKLNPNFGVPWDKQQSENLSIIITGCTYYNNGETTIRVYKGNKIPKGYVKGTLTKPVKNKIWINNGTIETYILSSLSIPNGYKTGRLNKSVSGKFIVNNGIKSKYLIIGTNIPLGWYKGPIKIKCENCGALVDKGNYSQRHGNKCKKGNK